MTVRFLVCSLLIALTTGCNVLTMFFGISPRDAPEKESTLRIQSDSELLPFTDFHVNEARFNPSVEEPVALTIMSSTTFRNDSGARLAVRFPRLSLEINGIYWTELASTDFQMGRLQTKASLTIELQSLLLMKKIAEEQQPIVEAIQAGEAVDIRISGTILIFPNDEETVVNLDITEENIVLPSAWLHPESAE